MLWLASAGLYARDYGAGLPALFALGMAHAFLEFPLDARTLVSVVSGSRRPDRTADWSRAAARIRRPPRQEPPMPTVTTRRKRRRAARPAAPAAPPPSALVPRRQVPCGLCGLCCTYVTADIAPPRGVGSASRILWYLYHPGVSVYRDAANSWLVQFESRCRFFADDRSCSIYARRPQVCRDFDARECEVNAPDEGLTLAAPEAFLAWLARCKPALHARLLASGRVPSAETLRGVPPARAPLAPFARRYAALRALGAPGADDAHA